MEGETRDLKGRRSTQRAISARAAAGRIGASGRYRDQAAAAKARHQRARERAKEGGRAGGVEKTACRKNIKYGASNALREEGG